MDPILFSGIVIGMHGFSLNFKDCSGFPRILKDSRGSKSTLGTPWGPPVVLQGVPGGPPGVTFGGP